MPLPVSPGVGVSSNVMTSSHPAVGLTGPYPNLVKRRPPGTLAGLSVFLPVMVHVLFLVAFQIGGLFYLQSRAWWVEYMGSSGWGYLSGIYRADLGGLTRLLWDLV